MTQDRQYCFFSGGSARKAFRRRNPLTKIFGMIYFVHLYRAATSPACWTRNRHWKFLYPKVEKSKNISSLIAFLFLTMTSPNTNRHNGLHAQSTTNNKRSTIMDLLRSSTEEDEGPSRSPPRHSSPVEERSYPPHHPYWNEKGTPMPTPVSSDGKGKASAVAPHVPPLTEKRREHASPSATDQLVEEYQKARSAPRAPPAAEGKRQHANPSPSDQLVEDFKEPGLLPTPH